MAETSESESSSAPPSGSSLALHPEWTRRRARSGATVVEPCRATESWGTVHLALLPTNEDRAKAVVDWAGAGFTHQRSGRISVDPDEGRELVAAEEPSSKGKR